tara:strand:- start:2721 stop:2918 length:198 start_codon:yes stop_codon:yes gene_type:complete
MFMGLLKPVSLCFHKAQLYYSEGREEADKILKANHRLKDEHRPDIRRLLREMSFLAIMHWNSTEL